MPGLQKLFEQFKDLALEQDQLKEKIGQSELSSFREEVECRRKVLKRLGHLNSEGVLTLKGKAAAEVRACCRAYTPLASSQAEVGARDTDATSQRPVQDWRVVLRLMLGRHGVSHLLGCLVPCYVQTTLAAPIHWPVS